MPERKKTLQTTNSVTLTGKLADLDIRHGTKANPRAEQINISGHIQIGDDPNFKVPFRNNFPIKKYRKDGGENKTYAALTMLPGQVKTIADVGLNEATTVQLRGRIFANDFVTNGELVESVGLEPSSIQQAPPTELNDYSRITFKGAVRTIKDEVNKQGEETGRLKMEVVGLDFMGTAVPFTFIVPEALAEAVKDTFEPRMTSTFYLQYGMHMVETTPTENGGIGVRFTEGYSRLERILLGADTPCSEDESGAISSKVLKEAMAKRQENLDAKLAWAEQRSKPAASTDGFQDTDDLPF